MVLSIGNETHHTCYAYYCKNTTKDYISDSTCKCASATSKPTSTEELYFRSGRGRCLRYLKQIKKLVIFI